LDGPLARQFGLDKEAKGVVVADVMESGPAHEAGLRAGDVILRYDGRALDSAHELQRVVAETPVGRQVELQVWRDKAPKSLKLKIADMADYDGEGAQASEPGQDKAPRLGLQVRALSSEEAQVRRLDRGVVVESVEEGSPAERAGLRPRDIILELDQARITSPGELARLAGKLKAGDAAIVRIQRGGRSLYLTIQLDEK
jgi:serine protease Do